MHARKTRLFVHAQVASQEALSVGRKTLRLLKGTRQERFVLTAGARQRVGKDAHARPLTVVLAQVSREAFVAAVQHAGVQVGRQLVDLFPRS